MNMLHLAAVRQPLSWALAAVFMWAVAPAACAQAAINKCRIDGRLVLQSGPCPVELQPAARMDLRATPVQVLAPVAASTPHKRTLAEALRARDGGDPPPSHTMQRDGALVLRERMGAV